MQYLLTEDEMAAFRAQRTASERMPSLEWLGEFVKYVACNATGLKPGKEWHTTREPSQYPHGCIHVPDDHPMYCDFCPCAKICPLPKDWSK